MGVKIITDTSADIPAEEAAQLGLEVIPFKTMFGTEEYLDGVTLQNEEFYRKLEQTDVFPTTCQITPFEFEQIFARVTANGDEAVVLPLSGELSGTAHNAAIAAGNFTGKVYVVDSLNATIGLHLLVRLAAQLIQEGKSARDVAQILEEKKRRLHLYALIDTLEYLKRGGRISKTVAFAGTLLSIKPIIAVNQGRIDVIDKARGLKNAEQCLRKYVQQTAGMDFTLPFGFTYSGVTDERLKKYMDENPDFWKNHEENMYFSQLGSTIGAHIGPGAVAISFFEK